MVRIFIVRIDVPDIPPRSRTFIRQRTCATPTSDTDGLILRTTSSTTNINNFNKNTSFLRYLINLRLATDRAGKLYLHTDIRLLFSNNSTNIDAMNLIASSKTTIKRGTLKSSPSASLMEDGGNHDDDEFNGTTTYELMTTTEMPQKPKYSPIK